jgi:hypothetical protein
VKYLILMPHQCGSLSMVWYGMFRGGFKKTLLGLADASLAMNLKEDDFLYIL